MGRMKKGQAKRKGFTLIEILVVVTIIGILASLVAWRLFGYLGEAKVKKAMADIRDLSSALDLYRLSHGEYPGVEKGLKALTEKSAKNPQGIIAAVPRDPWGREYEYVYPGKQGPFDIICYGKDGREGGEGEDADITSWNLTEIGY